MDQIFRVYLLASKPYGTLYCGHTDDLARRIWEHKQKVRKGFTSRYGVYRLVWYEMGDTREGAFIRERQIKKWRRAWKIQLIEALNPAWSDLAETLNC
jgi:putative endonuclease